MSQIEQALTDEHLTSLASPMPSAKPRDEYKNALDR
jgi:hypothetical protein